MFEALRDLFSPVEQSLKFRSFRKTVYMIRSGIPLYEYSNSELSARGVMGPWMLNGYESIISGIPGSVYLWISDLLDFNQSKNFDMISHVQEKFLDTFIPFIIPFSILVLAPVAAMASLKPKDWFMGKCKRATRAYLYLDGSYGLAPQMLNSFFSTVWFSTFVIDAGSTEIIASDTRIRMLSGFLAYLFSIPVWHVSMSLIPKRLFVINGYQPFPANLIQGQGPWEQYWLTNIALFPIIVMVIVLSIGILSSIFALLVVEVLG